MRGRGAWKWTAVLLMGMSSTATVLGAEPDDTTKPAAASSSGNWFSRWFKRKPKPEEKKPAAKLDKEIEEKMPPRPVVDPVVSARMREEADYLRRLAVCDQLALIALETQDENLERRTEKLKELVWNTYTRRLNYLPARTAPVETDEQVLDKRLGSTTSERGRADSEFTSTAKERKREERSTMKEDEAP